jgi:glycosyltransferase involved in cell wall biosynthesis
MTDLSTTPFLSVIIPTKNEEALLAGCLESFRHQDTTLPWELIIVDSSTAPTTRAIAESFGARVIEQLKLGKGLAVKTGAEASRGQILCFTEADCRVTPHWLSTIANVFKTHPQAVGAVGIYSFFDGSFCDNFLVRIAMPLSVWGFYVLYHNHSIRGTNFAVTAEAYHKAGGVNPVACELQDVEFGLRLARIGPIRYVREMKIQTSDRRIRGRLAKFIIRENLPALFGLLVKKMIRISSTYEDIR